MSKNRGQSTGRRLRRAGSPAFPGFMYRKEDMTFEEYKKTMHELMYGPSKEPNIEIIK